MKKETKTTDRYTLGGFGKLAWESEVTSICRFAWVFSAIRSRIRFPLNCKTRRFETCKISYALYARFHIRTNELRSALSFLRDLDFIGINLTVPHKIAAFTQIDETDESAARAGAVNTIRVRDEKG